jgi:hypothetical protein
VNTPSTPLPEGAASLGSLAQKLHAQLGDQPSDLAIEIPDPAVSDLVLQSGMTLVQNKLQFANRQQVNEIAAQHIANQLGSEGLHSGERLFAEAHLLWINEIGETDCASGRLLAIAQTQVDVLALAAAQIAAGSNVFNVLHCIEAFLPFATTLSVESLIALTDAQGPKTERDMAGGQLFGHLRSWFKSHEDVAIRVARALLADPFPSRANLLASAWLGWFDSQVEDAAASLLSVDNDPRAPLPGLCAWTAARMLEAGGLEEGTADALRATISARVESADEQIRLSGVEAATHLLHIDATFDVKLRAVAERQDQRVLGQIAHALIMKARDLLAADRLFCWLRHCVWLKPEHGASQLDFVLSSLLKPGGEHEADVLDFFTHWVVSHGTVPQNGREFPEVFHSSTQKILADPAILAKVLTRWFMDDQTSLSAAASAIVQHNRALPPAAALDLITLEGCESAELQFLAKRLTGWIISPVPLLTLLLSMTKVSRFATTVKPWIGAFLTDEVGYDYPGTTIRVLRSTAESQSTLEATQALTEAADVLEARMKLLDALPQIRELVGPTHLRRRLFRLRARQTTESQKKADENSIIDLIASKVYLKAGNQSFFFQGEGFSQPMSLKPYSITIELPRRESLDPVGNAYRMFTFRSAKRPK